MNFFHEIHGGDWIVVVSRYPGETNLGWTGSSQNIYENQAAKTKT
jgi:hypothetical protein